MDAFYESKEKIEFKINKINKFISGFEWMFFEVRELNQSVLKISGMLDELLPKYLLNIYFDYPHSLMCPLTWEIDKTNQFIQLDYEEGLVRMNICFNTEIGNYIFKLEQSNIREGASNIYIAARGLRMEVIE